MRDSHTSWMEKRHFIAFNHSFFFSSVSIVIFRTQRRKVTIKKRNNTNDNLPSYLQRATVLLLVSHTQCKTLDRHIVKVNESDWESHQKKELKKDRPKVSSELSVSGEKERVNYGIVYWLDWNLVAIQRRDESRLNSQPLAACIAIRC